VSDGPLSRLCLGTGRGPRGSASSSPASPRSPRRSHACTRRHAWPRRSSDSTGAVRVLRRV